MSVLKLYFEKKFNTISNFKYLFSFSWLDGKKIIILNILYSIVSGLMPILSLQISKKLMDILANNVNRSNSIEFISYNILILLSFTAIINILQLVFEHIRDYVYTLNRKSIEIKMEIKILNKLKMVDLGFFDNSDSLNLYNKVRSGININPSELFNGLFSIMQYSITFVTYLISLNAINIDIFYKALLIIISLGASIFRRVIMAKQNKLEQLQFEEVNLEQRKSKYFTDLFLEPNIHDEFKIFDAADYFINKIETINNNIYVKLKKSKYKIHNYNRLGAVGSEMIRKISYIGIVYLAYINMISFGDFILLKGLLEGLFTVLLGFNQSYKNLTNNLYYVTYLKRFLKFPVKILENLSIKKGININGGSHTIEFKDVYFKYSGMSNYILNGVSFVIYPNEIVAIAGVNGSGKSTIIKLLLRLYEVNEGSILIDNLNIKEYNPELLYSAFGVLFQDFCKYSLSIAETIHLGNLKNTYSKDKIDDALIKSDMYDFVNEQPHKENTLLSKRFTGESIDISIGQWQKLCIARALYGDKEIIILDEPTASLDIESEEKLIADMIKMRGTKTTLFISHNVSNFKICNRIIYLENGEIQVGDHDLLLRNSKSYSDLYYSQANRFSHY